ncbi:chemotaxis protein CheX [Oceanotoga sp. DSM 15011]|jgi:CheY-specific phosphatase CheX|uniref:CheY-specific phosphatase CheX n=1 Tax=Oceanotoga teriensis TaxID=515440 RepID=A0AA45C6A4_9BACT|nr:MULTISPECIES: chemotaxis protein CheX [Oceanotoga]MDN5343376.1 chemotaxis protein CheX [Oceanotoga sp.]MDO7975746.1 chemotaxis protein CheX [Oceanotoga teriensis]PWJ91275.1 CheY-specific phosphatase CheX [Oceanotoga teriensis]UYO99750.1 chemotaxis protein CheX [Oceanotoga sp. DSM 15011]
MENIEKSFLIHFINGLANTYNEYMEKFPELLGLKNNDDHDYDSSEKVTVNVGFAGKFSGNMTISFDKKVVFKMYEIINEENISNVDDEVLFMISEFGNMIAGNAITIINNKNKGYDLRLSPPGVMYGETMKIFNFNQSNYRSIFKTDNGSIVLNISIKEEF